VIVTGCLAERDKTRLLEKYPKSISRWAFLRGMKSPRRWDVSIGAKTSSGGCFGRPPVALCPIWAADALRSHHLAYLKIAEGCNRLCSSARFRRCAVPMRASPSSKWWPRPKSWRPTGFANWCWSPRIRLFYGLDIYGQPRLAELLRRLEEVRGLAWIRLMYLYPMHITEDLIDVLAGGSKVLPYLDLPLQHINDDVLRRMQRRGRPATDRNSCSTSFGKGSTGWCLRTTFDDGFSGRDRGAVRRVARFRGAAPLRAAGRVRVCPEPGTAAEELDGNLSRHGKKRGAAIG